MTKSMTRIPLTVLSLALGAVCAATALAQEILPFPPTPSASTAGLTMESSTYKKRIEPKRLAEGAPNILIILIDDVGPGTPSTYGGEINTPTLDRVAKMGISFNRFHSTAMCSPTRAALLTGRNHTFVGNGQISAIANDFDGFSGIIPKSSATVAEVLKDYGYNTGAWGKWHNTPEEQITSKGPFDYWPTGYGFEYFYGFLAGEASQYEPTLTRNTTQVTEHMPKGYHLTDDIATDAIKWLREQKAYAPDKPFFMYWATGASHGPHQIMKEWADKYKGKFDDGWDKYRERVFARAKAKGWIPQNAQLTPRPASMASWDSIPEAEKPFQRRLMEVFAGFTEHADYNAGRIIDEIERAGEARQHADLLHLGRQRLLVRGSERHHQRAAGAERHSDQDLAAHRGAEGARWTRRARRPQDRQHVQRRMGVGGQHSVPGHEAQGAYFGGIRQPMAVAWPNRIKADPTPRPQFHHVIDIVPTIYELTKITPPRVVNGFEQDPIAGVSMVYTFGDPKAPGTRKTQFFDIMASRGIYHDGWFASARGPARAVGGRDAERHQGMVAAHGQVGALQPRRGLEPGERSRRLESAEARGDEGPLPARVTKNKNLPIGGGMWSTAMFHPEDAPASSLTEWTFDGPMTRMPESAAPKLGKVDSLVTMEVDVPANANGVLYALAGFSGGVTCYVKDGILNYEFNLFEVQRTKIKAKEKLPTGKVKIEVESRLAGAIGGPMNVILRVNGEEVGQGRVPAAMSLHFTSNATFDLGTDLDSPVSLDYFDQAPFAFNGTMGTTKITYLKK